MSNTNKILDKISKLLALSKNNNSPEEAAAAAAMAQELLFNHKLSMADIDAAPDADDVLGTVDVSAPGQRWKASLVFGVARAFYCKGCSSGSGKSTIVRVVGKTSDTQAVSYMAAYLIKEIENLAKQRAGMGRSWVNSFKVGAVCTVINRLNEQKAAQDVKVESGDAGTALVLRNDAAAVRVYFKQVFPHTRKAPGARASHGGGFEAGKTAGASIGLGSGKGLGAPARQISGR